VSPRFSSALKTVGRAIHETRVLVEDRLKLQAPSRFDLRHRQDAHVFLRGKNPAIAFCYGFFHKAQCGLWFALPSVYRMICMNRILVIGATGKVGHQVVSQLVSAGAQVRAMTRNPDAADLPPQVEIMRGDLTVPETLDACLEGIETVFLVWVAPPATAAAVLERIARYALRIVFLSAPIKTAHPFFQQPNPVREMTAQIEYLIETSGLRWSFLRPGIFASNALRWWAPQIRRGDHVRWPYLSAPTAPIHEDDIARVAVRALCEDGHAGREYVLTGPQSLSQFDQVSTIGRVIGRSLRIEEISPDEARREWLPMVPAFVVNMLLDSWAAAIGQPALVTSTVGEITGEPARTFQEWATDHIAEFQS